MNHFTPDGQVPSEGLVQCHKNGRKPAFALKNEVKVLVYADLVTVKPSSISSGSRPRGDRKPIYEFSKRSRKAMLEKLAKLRNPTGGFFCTLTYPGQFTFTPDEVKTHLERFRKAFLREFPNAGVYWRLELKERRSGASKGVLVPHFHLLCFLYDAAIPQIDFRQWLATTWYRCVASENPDHLRAGTQADLIQNRKHAQRYASKYAAKDESEIRETISHSHLTWGRRWGTFGTLDLAAALEVTISLRQMYDLRRLAAALLKSRSRGYAKRLKRSPRDLGFSVFGLGDLSFDGWPDFLDSTIFKMLLVS